MAGVFFLLGEIRAIFVLLGVRIYGFFSLSAEGYQGVLLLAVVRGKHIHPSDWRNSHAGDETDIGEMNAAPKKHEYTEEEMVRRSNLHSGAIRKKRVYSSKYAPCSIAGCLLLCLHRYFAYT